MVEPVIGLAQPDQHRRIEPVLRFRPLDADQQHAAAPLNQDIAWLCGAGRSGRRRSCLRKRGADSRKAAASVVAPAPAIMKSRRAMPAGAARWASIMGCLLKGNTLYNYAS